MEEEEEEEEIILVQSSSNYHKYGNPKCDRAQKNPLETQRKIPEFLSSLQNNH
jgi:hypothetical protein